MNSKALPRRQMARLHRFAALASALVFLCAMPRAQAVVLFSESFDYSTGALAGKGPAAGSLAGATSWGNISGAGQVGTPGLDFTGDFSLGNKATIAGVAAANGDIASIDLSPVVGGVKWVGFLIRQASGPANPNGFAVVGLGANNGIGVLFNLNVFGIDTTVSGGPTTRAVSATTVSTSTVLLVAKLDFVNGMEYLFINPPTASEPANTDAAASVVMGSAFQTAGFSQIVLAAGSNTATFDFDELRIGTTFADTINQPPTPTPSPTPAVAKKIPTVAIKGKKKVLTAKSKLVLKGTSTNATAVEIKVGKGKYKVARGTSAWKFKAKLKPGRNKISIFALGSGNTKSAILKVKVLRE